MALGDPRFRSDPHGWKKYMMSKEVAKYSEIRIKRLYVTDLFATFTYDFSLKVDDKITILTAPNGYGKSTLLRMTKYLIQRQYDSLSSIPFREFAVTFIDGRTLRAVRKAHSPIADRIDVVELLDSLEETIIEYNPHSSTNSKNEVQLERRAFKLLGQHPSLEWVGRNEIYDRISRESLTYHEFLSRYGRSDESDSDSDLSDLDRINYGLPILYISADRLRKHQGRAGRHEESDLSPVDRISRMVSNQVQGSMSAYAQESRRIDSNFTQRILTELMDVSQDHVVPSSEDLRILAKTEQHIESSEQRFRDLGLFSTSTRKKPMLNISSVRTSSALKVLRMHFVDMEHKFMALEDIARRLNVFLNLLSELYDHKVIKFSLSKGLYVETSQKDDLDLNVLSSGEQHLLVLYGNLLFGEGAPLVMLDEPEISLHLEWQMKFLRHLGEIVNVRSLEIILATHSPTLIDRRDDLIVELKDIVAL